MGRTKIAIKKIENRGNLQVTFNKRRNGFLKKAFELATLCDCDVATILFSPSGKLTVFCRNNIDDIIGRYHNTSKDERRNCKLENAEFLKKAQKLGRECARPVLELSTRFAQVDINKEQCFEQMTNSFQQAQVDINSSLCFEQRTNSFQQGQLDINNRGSSGKLTVFCRNSGNLKVTFNKRRNGFLKKGFELATLCDCDVATILFSTSGKLTVFCRNNIDDVIGRYHNTSKDERRNSKLENAEFLKKAPKFGRECARPVLELSTRFAQVNINKEQCFEQMTNSFQQAQVDINNRHCFEQRTNSFQQGQVDINNRGPSVVEERCFKQRTNSFQQGQVDINNHGPSVAEERCFEQRTKSFQQTEVDINNHDPGMEVSFVAKEEQIHIQDSSSSGQQNMNPNTAWEMTDTIFNGIPDTAQTLCKYDVVSEHGSSSGQQNMNPDTAWEMTDTFLDGSPDTFSDGSLCPAMDTWVHHENQQPVLPDCQMREQVGSCLDAFLDGSICPTMDTWVHHETSSLCCLIPQNDALSKDCIRLQTLSPQFFSAYNFRHHFFQSQSVFGALDPVLNS